MLPLFSLAAGGVCRAVACCHRRGALLPHRFTLARTRLATSRWRTVLCCTVRGLSPPRCYLAPCSMQPGLSSMQCPCGPTPRPFNQRPTTGTRSVAVVGCWLLVVGCWLLVVGCWLLVVGCWLLVVGCWLLVVGCWLLVVGCWLLVVGCWLLVVGCWLLVVGCWLLAEPYRGRNPHSQACGEPVGAGLSRERLATRSRDSPALSPNVP